MPRKLLTLEQLVAEHRFDPQNFRHRRALDESGPLDDPDLEATRQRVVMHRRLSDRSWAAPALRDFARKVGEQG